MKASCWLHQLIQMSAFYESDIAQFYINNAQGFIQT